MGSQTQMTGIGFTKTFETVVVATFGKMMDISAGQVYWDLLRSGNG
jgi:hypothetical protein